MNKGSQDNPQSPAGGPPREKSDRSEASDASDASDTWGWLPRTLVLCFFAGLQFSATITTAQYPELEPRWLRLSFPQVSVGLETEGVSETVDVQGGTSKHDYLSLTPTLGLSAQGSVYHPDLVNFDFTGDGGLGYTHDSVSSPDQTRNERRDLLRYLAQVRFLSQKPYNANFYAAQDHTFNNYDFFNTTILDSIRYGGRAAWTTPTLSLGVDSGYRDERWNSLTQNSELTETFLNFNGINKRPHGNSTLNFHYSDFENTLNFGDPHVSINYSVGGSDSETFGSRKQITATTGASYSQSDSAGLLTETITANEVISANLRPSLDSFLSANYSRSSLEPVTSSVLQGVAGLRHKLYESLTTTFEVHGSYDENSSGTGSATDDRYGLGLREDYTKRLGSWGRLTMGAGGIVDHEDHQATESILTSIDESHQLYLTTNPNYRPAYLSHPNVIASTLQVRTASGIPARENIDYMVVPSGQSTEIRLVLGSTIIRDGDTVLVNYQSQSLFNASFETLSGNALIRLDLFNLIGLYGRVNWVNNNAPLEIQAETLNDYVAGMDFNWRWTRDGVEYEDFDSNFNKYRALRFFQDFSFRPSGTSTLGLNASESFYRYADEHRETRYQFTGRYNAQLAYWLSGYAEAGYSMEDVLDTKQNLFAARVGLTLTRGKFNAQLGYQYNYQVTRLDVTQEQRYRNYFFVHLKRSF